ncbi:hypothetical protein D9M68_986770 [compost metagenome]
MDSFVAELIAMPDEQVLEGKNPEEVLAQGDRLLEAARKEAGRRRLAAAKSAVQARRGQLGTESHEAVDVAFARKALMNAQNDSRFTLAARKLGELPDEEVLRLYQQMLSLQERDDLASGRS